MALSIYGIPRHGAWKAGWRNAWFSLSCSCYFSISFFIATKSVVPRRRKGLLPWSLTQYFVCPHSLLNLLFSGFTHTIGGRLGGEKNMWALFYLFISAAFSMGWDYAERMLYLSTWMFFMDKRQFGVCCLLIPPEFTLLKLGTQSL